MAGDRMAEKRRVGRPRHLDDETERKVIFASAYSALRDHGAEFTVANVLAEAGVSTRSFYRHFVSKDALLCAMYRRDAQWAAARLNKRLADAASPVDAVERWIDEIFGFTRDSRRAERVTVLGSIPGIGAEGIEQTSRESRVLLVESLRAAIIAGAAGGVFRVSDADVATDLVAAVVLHAAGLAGPATRARLHHQRSTVEFCLRALGFDPRPTP